MKTRHHDLIRSLVVAAVIVGVAAPIARAGHQDLGARCALLLSQHRGSLCGRPASSVREDQPGAVTPSVTIVEPSSFDWGDAGVGAAGTFGLMMLAGGVVITSRHSHRSTASSRRRGVDGNLTSGYRRRHG